MKKYNLQIIALFALLGFVGTSVLSPSISVLSLGVQQATAAAAATKTAVAYVSEVKGGATVNGVQTAALAKVYVGDKLATKKDGFLSIIFTQDKSVLRLNKLSAITISASNPQKTTIQAEEGGFWTRILKGMWVKGDYEVKTKSTSASIRGTSAFFQVDATKKEFGVQVLDSYSTLASQLGVKVKTAGSSKITQIKPEQTYTYNSATKKAKGGRIKVASSITKDEFLKENMRKDLSYMTNIASSYTKGTKAFLTKVKGELKVSLPVGTEKSALFYDTSLAKNALKESTLAGTDIQELLLKDEYVRQASLAGVEGDALNLVRNMDLGGARNLDEMMATIEQDTLSGMSDIDGMGVDTSALLKEAKDSLQSDWNTLLQIDIDLVGAGESVTTTTTQITCPDANTIFDAKINKCIPKSTVNSCIAQGGEVANGEYDPIVFPDGSVACEKKCNDGYVLSYELQCVKPGAHGTSASTIDNASVSCGAQLPAILNGYYTGVVGSDGSISCTNHCNEGFTAMMGTTGAPICMPNAK